MIDSVPAFSVKPNPVQAGGTVTIKGSPNTTLHVFANGKKTTIKLDGRGDAKMKEPVGAGNTFTISEASKNGAFEVDVSVIETLK